MQFLRKLLYCLILIALFTGIFYLRSRFSFSRTFIAGQKVRITERITEQPNQKRSTQTFRLKNFLIVTKKFPAYNYGDVLQVEGIVKITSGSQHLGLLKRLQPTFSLIYPKISKVDDEEKMGFPQEGMQVKVIRLVTKWRVSLVRIYRKYLPEPHASLFAGIVVGERAEMPEAFYTALQSTGTLHVIAASGMNLTIVAGVIGQILVRFLKRRWAIMGIIAGIILYTLLAGMTAPIIRAAIMAVIALVAMMLGKEKDAGIALGVTAGVMLIYNPAYLIDIGWQLSFAATIGIIFLVPVIERYTKIVFERVPINLGSELAVTLAAQVTTLPILIYHFGQFSWIAPVVNLLIALVVPVIMIWGGVVAIAGSLWLPLGQIISWGAWVFLEYFVLVVEVFSKMFGSIQMKQVSLWWIIGYYFIITWLFWQLKRKSERQF